MTPETFKKWLNAMKMAGFVKSDAQCAKLLDVSANAVVGMKKNGADHRTALACQALIHQLEPYS